ncbi:MAG: hypothetical protein ACRDQ0_21380 [Pseudonocardia sp.]
MSTVSDILTLLAAAGGLGILLVMAVVPLLVDRHRPQERTRVVPLPAQRTAVEDAFRRPSAGLPRSA